MKFGFKQQAVAAILALSASTVVHAAIENGELAFFAANGSTNSVLFDLGLTMAQFSPSFTGSIVWVFDASGGPVTTNDEKNDATISAVPCATNSCDGSMWKTLSSAYDIDMPID